MFKTLKESGIKFKERRIIHKLYMNQIGIIKVDETVKEVRIKKGVRQGCSLSPLIFNLYIEEALSETGIRIHGERIPMIRFADILIISESEKDLNEMLIEMERILVNRYNMKINRNKTKVMACGRKISVKMNIVLGNQIWGEVEEFCYLGSKITKDVKCQKEIRSRIAQVKKAFYQKQQLLTLSNVNLETRKKFLRSLVWSTALYGCEIQTVSKEEKKRLESF
jgi:hypothetical protein